MKTVFFLGAGFSAAWGLPVMNNFFQKVSKASYLDDKQKKLLKNIQEKVRRAEATFKVELENIEDVLSFYLVSEYFSDKLDDSDSDYQKLCFLLFEVYKRSGDFSDYWNLPTDKVKRFLALKEHADQISIITTNWDITLDYCLWKIGLPIHLPFEWTTHKLNINKISKSIYSKSDSGILLCKFHGSVNWFEDPEDNNKLLVADQVLFGTIVDRDSHEILNTSFPEVSGYQPKAPPLIVPPTFFKLKKTPFVGSTWEAAGQVLREAENIIFVGYSFPESDAAFQYFLADQLNMNTSLENIHIVDPQAETIRVRLLKRFGTYIKNNLGPNLSGAWENIDVRQWPLI